MADGKLPQRSRGVSVSKSSQKLQGRRISATIDQASLSSGSPRSPQSEAHSPLHGLRSPPLDHSFFNWDTSKPSSSTSNERIFPIRSAMTKSPSGSTIQHNPDEVSQVPPYSSSSEFPSSVVSDSSSLPSAMKGKPRIGGLPSNVRITTPRSPLVTDRTDYFDRLATDARRPSSSKSSSNNPDASDDDQKAPNSPKAVAADDDDDTPPVDNNNTTPSGSGKGESTASNTTAVTRPSNRNDQAASHVARSERASTEASAHRYDEVRARGGIGVYASNREIEMMDRASDARKRAAAGKESVSHSYGEQIMTVRFEHQETEEGHMILTGREGVITKCEDEPIHVPGAVQNWGVLLAVEYDLETDGPIKVKQVSENSGHLLGWPPAYLFGLDCLTEALDEEEGEALREALSEAQATEEGLTEAGPHYFELSGRGLPGTGLDGPESLTEWTCWAAAHKPSQGTRPNLYCIELELQEDNLNPPITTSAEPLNDEERSGLAGEPYEPTEEDLLESTVSSAKPLATSRKRRRAKNVGSSSSGSAGSGGMDVFHTLNQVQDQLSKASDLPSFLKLVVGVIKDLTNYHRVMIYQFDESWNGQVVAELVDWSKTRDLYRGLHFPATDIPAQAREMYKINRVRLLYDRDQPTSRMVCSSRQELEVPLDMTHLALRAMSPIHIKYLANMGVRASGSVSITAFGSLWGLISCHTYGRYGMRITSPQRQLCRILGNDISRNIERLSYAQRLQSRKLINTVSTEANPSGYIVAKAEDLLTLFDAEFGVLSIGEEAKLLGSLENSQEALAVLEYLRIKKFTTIQVTQNLEVDYPDLKCPGNFRVVAGFLSIPLTATGRDFITFFRRGQIKHIHWAGNPYDKILKETAATHSALEPRTSFKLWSETIMGKSRAWSDEQLETASVLCLVYGKFIDVWRQKESALKSNQLTNLLLSNASHEVRTPLNAIVNYLEMALDGPLDGETRDALRKSYTASRALIHVINDLLDLTRAEEGNELFLRDPFEIASTIEEAIEIHRSEADRRKISFDVVCTTSNPPSVIVGDRARLKQVLSNLVSNAVRHTKEGSVVLEWGLYDDTNTQAVVKGADDVVMAFVVADTGEGIPATKLDEIFRQLEQVESYEANNEQKNSTAPLGLGLAVVARIVRNLGGQLRVESVEGQGSKFTALMPCRLGNDDAMSHASSNIKRSSSKGSMRSVRSNGSSEQLSEIDSLVDAITSNPSVSSSVRSAQPSPPDPSGRSLSNGDENASRPDSRHAKRLSIQLDKNGQRIGSLAVEDSNTPLKAVRLDMDDQEHAPHQMRPFIGRTHSTAPPRSIPPTPPQSPYDNSNKNMLPNAHDMQAQSSSTGSSTSRPWSSVPASAPARQSTLSASSKNDVHPLRVLVVEDDPINRAIIHKKLAKEGHDVKLTVQGEEAVRAFEADPNFDVILMDLQMPICDGYTATRRIRDVESKTSDEDKKDRPDSHKLIGRIPIIAVSASLHERQVPELMETGMDAWLLKPINFERMRIILAGVTEDESRGAEAYQLGFFQKGGWL